GELRRRINAEWREDVLRNGSGQLPIGWRRALRWDEGLRSGIRISRLGAATSTFATRFSATGFGMLSLARRCRKRKWPRDQREAEEQGNKYFRDFQAITFRSFAPRRSSSCIYR